ncbi:MAG TPA: ABC transporter ATP-binding protein [Candidatus Merdicola faecigallinarum]|uniref:ABC transporter ATP-binding protein n=1 Tax=Candidatus Merdicola faecigallinarum TaxID=2840862 RepID=A0A9D1LZR2_9FIRM|nr:ABC transporter ATP-binding protein [Candidatus Merdicola faecigallinarum]
MLKVLRHLKESAISVIFIVILLCIQAATDLSLPTYTSKIVNIGIQQGGIESAAPEVIAKEQMDELLKFTNEDEKILNHYELISKEDKKYDKYVKDYPEVANQKVYKRKDIKEEEVQELSAIMAKPLLVLTSLVAPDEVSKEDMELLLSFTENREEVLNSYTLSEDGNIYKLNDISSVEKGKLSNHLTPSLLMKQVVLKEDSANKIKEVIIENMPENQKVMMEQKSLLQILQMLPKENINELEKKIEEELPNMLNELTNNLSESMIEQAAIQEVKTQYQYLGANTDDIQNNYIWFAGLQMIGIASITMISAVTIMLLSARVAAKLSRTLREKVFKKVLSFSTEEFNEFSTASLITRTTNDIQQIQMLLTLLFRVIVYAPIIAIGGFIRVLFNSEVSMAWIIALAVGCIVIIVLTLMIIAMPRFKKLQKLVDKLNLVSREILAGTPVIRAFNKEKHEEERFDVANKDLMKTQVFVNRAMSIMMPGLMLVMNCISVLIVWVGGHYVDAGTMQIGDVMAFIQYTMQIVMAFLMISMVSIMLPRATVSAGRINEVLEKEPRIKDKKETKAFKEDKKGYVEFKNVSFHYPDADTEVISDISFTAKPGETTALIGSTGSGKSTIVNLIPRFYDVTGGELLIDGTNIKDVKQTELRKRIGFVPQKGMLFSGTIESNIKYGNENISDKQMIEAAQIAQAEEFIEGKTLKYQEPIAQGGGNVSGGQKQRLSIARAIAIDPEILVFDDSFSALDLKTDKILREELEKHTKDKTVIIVAQRISTIMNANQIIVLDEGKIVGKGTHEELMKICETYQQIALSQLSKEELENGRE